MTATGDGSPQDALERWYRRLLLAYPAHYRRHRGVEILTTLMDAAPAGRIRPRVGQIIDLLFGGLRYRLSPGRTPIVVAILAALFAGVFGAIGGSLAGWQSGGDLPDNTTAASIARTAIPAMPPTPYDRHDFLFGYDPPNTDDNPVVALLLPGDNYGAGHVQFTARHTADDLAMLQAARERLQAAGWRVESVARKSYGGELSASRSDLFIQLTTEGGTNGWANGEQETSLRIYRAKPSAVSLLSTLGLFVGGLTGWGLAGWAARRVATQPTWRKVAAIVPFIFASALMILPMCLNLIAIVGSLIWANPTPAWAGFVIIPTRALALLGTPLLISALLIAAIPSAPGRWRPIRTGA